MVTGHACRSSSRTRAAHGLAALPGASGVVCTGGMTAGLMIDIWLSPLGSIAAFCGGGDPPQRLMLHTMLMPFAHSGMAVGIMLCGACRYLSGTSRVPALLLWLAAQAVLMTIAACTSLLLIENADPIPMMSQMAVIMIVMDVLALTSFVNATKYMGSRHRHDFAEQL